MAFLNYHHLRYFWAVNRYGSLQAAARALNATPPTLSVQIRALEDALGARLFERAGRRLRLTATGERVARFAEEIFALGHELTRALSGEPPAPRLRVGVTDQVPKLVAWRLLDPVRGLDPVPVLHCVEDRHQRLLADLAVHRLDVIVADAPAEDGARLGVFNHLLGECGVVFFAAPAVARRLRSRFPGSLHGQPFLMPAPGAALRRHLEAWWLRQGIEPVIAGEFQDSALLKIFGQAGSGVFAAPEVIADDVARRYRVRVIGATREVRERFYVQTADRRVRDPAVAAILASARGLEGLRRD